MESIPTTSFETEARASGMSLDSTHSSPIYYYIFGFEKDFDHVEVKKVSTIEIMQFILQIDNISYLSLNYISTLTIP